MQVKQEGVEWCHEGIHHAAMYILVSQRTYPHFHLTECCLPLDDFRFLQFISGVIKPKLCWYRRSLGFLRPASFIFAPKDWTQNDCKWLNEKLLFSYHLIFEGSNIFQLVFITVATQSPRFSAFSEKKNKTKTTTTHTHTHTNTRHTYWCGESNLLNWNFFLQVTWK